MEKSLLSINRNYQKVEYPTSDVGSKTVLTGVQKIEGSEKIYIAGTYTKPDGINSGFVYKGNLSGKGNWYILNYPDGKDRKVSSTSISGINFVSADKDENKDVIRAIGTYTVKESNDKVLGFLYQGTLDGTGKWTTLVPEFKRKITETSARGVIGGFVVGNYKVRVIKNNESIISSRAFLYDIDLDKYYKIKIPHSDNTTAHGIWQGSKVSYLICGSFQTRKDKSAILGYIVEFNKNEMCFKQLKSYKFSEEAKLTAFNSIVSDEKDGYNLIGNAIDKDNVIIAFIANIKGAGKDIVWETVSYPKSESTIINGICSNIFVGVYQDKNKTHAYIST